MKAELRRNLSAVMADAETMGYMDNPVQEYATLQKVLRFFSQLSDKLKASTFFDDESNRPLRFTLERAIKELGRGFRYDEFLEHS